MDVLGGLFWALVLGMMGVGVALAATVPPPASLTIFFIFNSTYPAPTFLPGLL